MHVKVYNFLVDLEKKGFGYDQSALLLVASQQECTMHVQLHTLYGMHSENT